MGSNGATAQGTKMFERLNKVVLASWENIVTRKSAEKTALIQAAVIGQTFAYLSGNPEHLAILETFHGTVISWARRSGMFNVIPVLLPLEGQDLDECWKSWARSEEMTRTALGLCIHDAQLASMFHHDPILRHNALRLPAAASDELFSAPCAAQWAVLIQRCKPTRMLHEYLHVNQPAHSPLEPLIQELDCSNSRFSCYVILHGIGAAVQESNGAGNMSAAKIEKYQDALLCWYHVYQEIKPQGEYDPFCLMILFHEIFMSLLVDFNELGRAIGRDGASKATEALRYVGPWASSVQAKRCAIHATLIHRQVGSMWVNSEPAIHVPRSMFLAAIAWYCYSQFGKDCSASLPLDGALDFPEIKIFNVNPVQQLFEAGGYKGKHYKLIEASPLCGLTDMLHRIGHWGISRKFARILGLLINRDVDDHLVDFS